MTSSEAASSEATFHEKLKFVRVTQFEASRVVSWIEVHLILAED